VAAPVAAAEPAETVSAGVAPASTSNGTPQTAE
jgi:hypothetical protein